MTVACHSCNQSFTDYQELALHIASSRKGHRQGKKWAAKYLLRVRALAKRELNGRTVLTEADKDNKKDMVRVLSGEQEQVLAVCPHCHHGHRELLPVEFTQSPIAWRIKKNLVILCGGCK